jgi:hypothetical protein
LEIGWRIDVDCAFRELNARDPGLIGFDQRLRTGVVGQGQEPFEASLIEESGDT